MALHRALRYIPGGGVSASKTKFYVNKPLPQFDTKNEAFSCSETIFLTSSYGISPLSHIAWCIEHSVIKLLLSKRSASFALIGTT